MNEITNKTFFTNLDFVHKGIGGWFTFGVIYLNGNTWHVTLVVITGTIKMVPYQLLKSLQLIWRLGRPYQLVSSPGTQYSRKLH